MSSEPRELKPFHYATSVAQGSTAPPPPSEDNAFELLPLMIFAPSRTAESVRDMRPQFVAEPTSSDPIEDIKKIATASDVIVPVGAETPADADPKAVTSSVIDSASDSGSDSSAKEPMHPSSLSDEKVTPAPVVKESSQSDQPFSLPTSPGFQAPPAWELEPLPTTVISSSPDEVKPAS